MSGNVKIRLLLFLLAIGFACTAITINITFDKSETLNFDGRKIERRLHNKEQFIKHFLEGPNSRDLLRNITENTDQARYVISEIGEKRNIYLQTFEGGQPQFWNGNSIILETDSLLKEGSTFIHWDNGYYEAIKKSWGTSSVVCYIPVMTKYSYQNEYLRNEFSNELIVSNDLNIASLNDHDVYNIRSIDGKYLFSVKLKPGFHDNAHVSTELWMWILSVVFALAFLSNISISLANRGSVWWAILLLAAGVVGFRLLDLRFRWFATRFELEVFNPKNYASNYFSPSIAELLLNVLAFTWIIVFIHSFRLQLIRWRLPVSKVFAYFVFIVTVIIIWLTVFATNELFFGLIANSNINFDVTDVLNANWLSWLGIIIFCFSILNIFLLIDTGLVISDSLPMRNRERLLLFGFVLTLGFLYKLFFSDFTLFFLLFATIPLILGWAFYRYKQKFNPGVIIICLLIFAVIGSIKLSRFQFLRERENRKLLIAKLDSSTDPNAVLLFYNIEKEILHDSLIIDYFKNPLASQAALNNRLAKLYMAGYLSRYDFDAYEYNSQGQAVVAGRGSPPLSAFKDFVLKGSVKVSDYFYRRNNTFGVWHYFALLPISDGSDVVGTLVLELKTKHLEQMDSFPRLLVDGNIKEDVQLKDYSYAYYHDDKLLNQHGRYVYNLRNNEFKGRVNDFVFVRNYENDRQYSHLVYQPSPRKLIILSKEMDTLFNQLASVSLIFLIMIFFMITVYLLHRLWNSIHNYNISFRNFRWTYLITTNRMLYKTRIQFSMVSAVVITLAITGIITFYNISRQYREQQEETVMSQINKISMGINRQLSKDVILTSSEQTDLAFNNYADLNGVDLYLFDLNGNLIHSTQPKIYENGLIARKMNPMAYLYLNSLQKSEFVHLEKIGYLSYISAYMPVRDAQNEAIAYLGLPYFSNERDFDERIGLLLNGLINVYVLVFVAIGFFAVFVANRITNPLSLIQRSLREIKIGQKNEPISWKRNDEIGNLIKEYNTMIAALEDSAQKLAKSERETAWREMAKQVAHEIKNPLTPLKLGVQLLDKSWKEKDPKFDAKFEKFSKSFIEQIESLSHIASEFSNFAKMPDTVLEGVYVKDIVDQSIELYRQSAHTRITLENKCTKRAYVKADKDQLLRCFNNLIKNAIEARKEKQQCLIHIIMYCNDEEVFIEIKDNGIGISESLGEKIFMPNFTTKSSGTGLGLAFVKQAIENIEGSILFKTGSGRGTTFYITLPMKDI